MDWQVIILTLGASLITGIGLARKNLCKKEQRHIIKY